VPDRRNAEDANVSSVLRYFPPPVPHRPVLARHQLRPYLLEERLHTTRLDGLERHPVDSRGAVVLPGQRIGGVQRLPLADMNVQPPEPPGWVSLRLDVHPPPQVLQTDRRLYHLAAASHRWRNTCSRAPSLHGHYSASPLLRARPTPSRLRPLFRGPRSYGLPCFRLCPGGAGRVSPVAVRV